MSDRKYVYLVEPPQDPALQGWQAALAGRESARANVVLIGPSTVEGFPLTNFDKTPAQVLARMLRAKFPTPGLGTIGGRGRIGVPNQGLTPAIPSPLTFTGGTFDPVDYDDAPSLHFGANHTSWRSTTVGHKVVITLKPWETAFDIVHVAGSTGHATGGYYKVNDETAVNFSTHNASNLLRVTRVDLPPLESEFGVIDGGTPDDDSSDPPADRVIEIGTTGSGYFTLSELILYGGDETKGIMVHGVGHAGYTTANWSANATTTAGWREALGNLAPSVIVLEAGMYDAVAAPASVFATNLASFISTLRAVGGPIATCPILLVAPYNADGGLDFMDPWDFYVAMMRTLANDDDLIAFLNEGDQMPPTDALNTYSLYHTDAVHSNANGRGYSTQSHLIAEALSFA